MLRYFPVPYKDELLYSQIARYHRHTCSPSYKQTVNEIFGSRTVTAVVDLPAHLRTLQQYIGHITQYSAQDTLWIQTLFPVYAPFLEPKLSVRVQESMLSDYGGDIHTRAGLSASSVKRPARLRVCPECLNEQVQRNGEAYWQRLFQIAGVLVCPLHRCRLRLTSIPYVPANKHHYSITPSALLNEGLWQFSYSDLEKLVVIAKDFSQLLQSRFKPVGHARWTAKYWELLEARQLVRGKNVRQTELADGFTSFWGNTVLAILCSPVSRDNEHSWLTAMARKHRKNVHPLRHILLYRYLAGINAPLRNLFKLLPVCSEPEKLTATKRHCTPKSEKDRKRWLTLQKKHPNLFAKKLRHLEPALYARLYRQDPEWLKKHTPYKRQLIAINKRVDWPKRDRLLARQIIRQARELKKNENRPRCSSKLLAQNTGCLSTLEKYLSKLPVTRHALKKYSETVTEYQCRRVDWVVARMIINQEPVTGWKIYRRANIRTDVSQEVKKYIQGKADEFVKACQVPQPTQG